MMRPTIVFALLSALLVGDAMAQSRSSRSRGGRSSRSSRPTRSFRSSSRANTVRRSSRTPSRSFGTRSSFRTSRTPTRRTSFRTSRTPTRRASFRTSRTPTSRSSFRTSRGSTRSNAFRTSRGSTRGNGFRTSRGSTRGNGFRTSRSSTRGNGYRTSRGSRSYGHGRSRSHHGHHSLFGFHFSFGHGAYHGFHYYHPYHHYLSGHHYGFFYSDPVSYAYVPYGFYCDAPATYVTRSIYLRNDYGVRTYEETDETEGAKPAAETPAAEKLLRAASEAFRRGEYLDSARKFRLAAIAAPGQAAPLFALGQALLALGSDDAYATRVIRKAVALNSGLVKEPGDIVGVYKSREEFDRVMKAVAARAKENADARFLLGVNQFLSGDPRARETFQALPEDSAVTLFREAVEKRFKAAKDLPEIK